ncbi:MAG: 8-oxo-dGTP diphosphatase [Lachnospiraceae bacterium]|nr:8-oxo-dGTP diphosphatase [Lachnospiraceae bacterium]
MSTELTTLCYIEKDGKYLMLHRTKKNNDPNRDLWLGTGGHLEDLESPHECCIREVKEETGLDIVSPKLRGVITFVDNSWCELMFLFTADEFSGELIECNEGDLEWVDKDKVIDLPAWEGDKIFLKKLINNEPFFSLKLIYDNRKLKEVILDN